MGAAFVASDVGDQTAVRRDSKRSSHQPRLALFFGERNTRASHDLRLRASGKVSKSSQPKTKNTCRGLRYIYGTQ